MALSEFLMAKVRGGKKFEAVIKSLSAKLRKAKVVRVGFLAGGTYPNRSRKNLRTAYSKRKAKGQTGAIAGATGGTPVAMVAAIQNFGAPKMGIPPRPFFSDMVREKQKEWPKALAENLKDSDYDAKKALDLVGFGIEGQLRESIIATNTPPNSPRTIKAKGGATKPLVDTGHMLNSVDHEVD